MGIVFKNPLIFSYTSEDEKKYRQSLVDYLNKNFTDKYSESELMVESNSHVVYKVTEKNNNKKTVLKFFREKARRDEEYFALKYWHDCSISVPKIISIEEINLGEQSTFVTYMEHIEGENMLSKFTLGNAYLNDEYGTSIANVLKKIDIDFSSDSTHFSECLYTPSYKKIVTLPNFEDELKKSFELYDLWRKNGKTRLIHGDFRDGNMINNMGKITIIDPGPALGHIATDFAYYIARSYISNFTNHLKSFIRTFLNKRSDLDLIRAVALLECSRLYHSFNAKNNIRQREKIIEMMNLIVLEKMLAN